MPKPHYPISVFPVQSDHGDVHTFHVARSNGDSLTVSDFRYVFERVTGHAISDDEIPIDWFAEEDRK
jgi:hypothetical protein